VFSPTDLAVAAFVALLVFGGLYLPRVGDAVGRLVRRMRGIRDDGGDAPPGR
jgi:Sec-independent protein translocase protein TatA